jgi:prepilin signal peptidase PulO-like enzyme (type II secretory pathway)
VNVILATPFGLRLAVLFALGAALGSLANWAAAVASPAVRRGDPWLTNDAIGLARWLRRVPIVGWFAAGQSRPLRPLLVEFTAGFVLAWLYAWEIAELGLVPVPLRALADPTWMGAAHAQFAAHAVLVGLMLVASLIDLDEKIIPDEVTVPGTLLGLGLLALLPSALLPDAFVLPNNPPSFGWVHATSPHPWPAWLAGRQAVSLSLALGCWLAWCFALLPRTWYTRHGLGRAVALSMARVRRQQASRYIGGLALVGSAAIAGVWMLGGPRWESLLTALTGMTVGGAMIWSVRAIGFMALRREAMGFGDVTLMAMIGAFLGWQACLVVFFVAPLAGLLVGVVQWVVARDNEIPYGPFLCLAALFVIARWATIWAWLAGVLSLGWFVPLMLVACLLLMAILLRGIRSLREAFAR